MEMILVPSGNVCPAAIEPDFAARFNSLIRFVCSLRRLRRWSIQDLKPEDSF
jgi:hypothetical protein